MTHPDGVLVLDKSVGPTSFDAIRALRRITGERKIGHAGTLDPLASGVLLLLFNKSTRLSDFLMSAKKSYEAEAWLGRRTTSDDGEGEVVEEREVVGVDEAAVREALEGFVGSIEQVPPAYSAIHVDGERAYDKMRRGEQVEMKARSVQVDAIELLSVELPRVTFSVTCGKGTYIRSLARDLGEVLGCGAYLSGLRRVTCGGFSVDEAVTMEQVEASEDWRALLESPLEAMRRYPQIELEAEEAMRLSNGIKLDRLRGLEPGTYRVPVPGEDDLLAVLVQRRVGESPKTKVFRPSWTPG